MATVQTAIIDRALRIVLGVETAGTAAQSALALTAVNAMIDSWRNEGLMASSVTVLSAVTVVGTSSYTLGPSGTFSSVRPLDIEDAYCNSDYPVNVLTSAQWNAIQTKTDTSDIITDLFYNPTYPLATLKVYPVPSVANTLSVTVRTDLTGFTALTNTVSLPPGWERALVYNLAIELSPEYGAVLDQATVKIATDSKAAIKHTNNLSPILMVPENAMMFDNHRPNIISGV